MINGPYELQLSRRILRGQIRFFGIVLLGALGLAVATWLWPDFFQYRYWYISETFWTDVLRFWPALLFAVIPSLLAAVSGRIAATIYSTQVFKYGLITSVGAGLLEELWYRGIGVFYAMIMLVVGNWFFSIGSWFFVVVSIIAIIGMVATFFLRNGPLTFSGSMLRLAGIAGSCLLIYGLIRLNPDPLYRIYDHLFYPIIDFVTFGTMHPVLFGDHQPLLVMGLISANFAFRDGHRYQGFIGWAHAWFFGCAMIFATLSYGIWVAVVVHLLYDALIDFIHYFGRRAPRWE